MFFRSFIKRVLPVILLASTSAVIFAVSPASSTGTATSSSCVFAANSGSYSTGQTPPIDSNGDYELMIGASVTCTIQGAVVGASGGTYNAASQTLDALVKHSGNLNASSYPISGGNELVPATFSPSVTGSTTGTVTFTYNTTGVSTCNTAALSYDDQSGSVRNSLGHGTYFTYVSSYGGPTLTSCSLPAPGAPTVSTSNGPNANDPVQTSFVRTYTWSVTKGVDSSIQHVASGAPATFNYTVTASNTSSDGPFTATGAVTVTNPNNAPISGVTAATSDTNCTISTGAQTIAANPATAEFDYSCTYATEPASGYSLPLTVSWPAQTPAGYSSLPAGNTTVSQTLSWGSTPTTVTDSSVTVYDTVDGGTATSLGTATVGGNNTFTYPLSFTAPTGDCANHTNTATLSTGASSSPVTVTVCGTSDPTVNATAAPSFTRTYKWGITKTVDQNSQEVPAGTNATYHYTVKATHDSGTDSAWQVAGNISVHNPNKWEAITLTGVSDSVDNGGSCTVSGNTTQTIAKSGDSTGLAYVCTYSSAPSPSAGTDTATVNWNPTAADTTDSAANGAATFDLSSTTPNIVDGTVAVTDNLDGVVTTLGSASYTDDATTTFSYPVTFTHDVAGTVTTHDNTATFTTDTTGTTGSASQTVTDSVGLDPTVDATAATSFNRTYGWDVSKTADKTIQQLPLGSEATYNYTVTATHDSGTDAAWEVSGNIDVHNPNNWESITLTGVSDAVDNGGSCTVAGDTSQTIATNSDSTGLTYACTYSSAPSPAAGTDTVTITWDPSAVTPHSQSTGTAGFDFSTTPPNILDGSATVVDSLEGSLGTLTYSDPSPTTYNYPITFTDDTPGSSTTHENTATITPSTSGTPTSSSVTVTDDIGVDPTVSVTATPSFTRTYTWDISKSVDQTSQQLPLGKSATYNYTVAVTHDSGTDSAWQVAGNISVQNPNDWEPITLTGVTDSVGNGGSCTVSGDTTQTIAAGGNATGLRYVCTYSSAPSPAASDDSVTVSWTGITPDSSATASAGGFDFSSTAPKIVDGSVGVTDTLNGDLGTVSYTDVSPKDFTYPLTFSNDTPGSSTSHANTASFTTDDTGTTGNSSQSVTDYIGVDPTMKVTSSTSFTRAYTWGIDKSVNETSQQLPVGKSATYDYSVSVTHDSGTDSAWEVTGAISIHNPNDWQAITLTGVTDTVDDGGSCTVSGNTTQTIAANGDSSGLTYVCTYSSAPSPAAGTDGVTVTWDPSAVTPDTQATASSGFDFSTTAPNIVDGSVNVNDTLEGNLGTVSYTQSSPQVFTYPLTFTGDAAATSTVHNNTASFVADTSGWTDSSSQTVTDYIGVDPTVSVTATPRFTRTYKWGINKSVDKTLLDAGGVANYSIAVAEQGYTDSAWQVTGSISIQNPNNWEPITLTGVTDTVSNGGSCTVSGNTTQTIAASGNSTGLSYVCTYSSAPSPATGTDSVKVTWSSAAVTPDHQLTGTSGVSFTSPTTKVNPTVTVSDPLLGASALGTVNATDATPYAGHTFTVAKGFVPPGSGCSSVTNTASLLETGQSSSVSLQDCNTGALSMGYWQNKNGQAILTGTAATNGVCNSVTDLRQYAPFQDLSATASCSAVATYVTNVIKAASAGGATENPMLKSQMLAVALDAYYSTQIGAPANIGNVSVDLTIGGQNTSAAFGGAQYLTVNQMLAYAASQSNAGGITWYSQNKNTQNLAQIAFQAIATEGVTSL